MTLPKFRLSLNSLVLLYLATVGGFRFPQAIGERRRSVLRFCPVSVFSNQRRRASPSGAGKKTVPFPVFRVGSLLEFCNFEAQAGRRIGHHRICRRVELNCLARPAPGAHPCAQRIFRMAASDGRFYQSFPGRPTPDKAASSPGRYLRERPQQHRTPTSRQLAHAAVRRLSSERISVRVRLADDGHRGGLEKVYKASEPGSFRYHFASALFIEVSAALNAHFSFSVLPITWSIAPCAGADRVIGSLPLP